MLTHCSKVPFVLNVSCLLLKTIFINGWYSIHLFMSVIKFVFNKFVITFVHDIKVEVKQIAVINTITLDTNYQVIELISAIFFSSIYVLL